MTGDYAQKCANQNKKAQFIPDRTGVSPICTLPADLVTQSGRRPMISKSKLGAMAFIIATIGLTSPAFAASIYSPSETGGGSWGYNHHMAIDQWRLRHHHGVRHTPVHHLSSKTQ
jgi:hypothetical protein